MNMEIVYSDSVGALAAAAGDSNGIQHARQYQRKSTCVGRGLDHMVLLALAIMPGMASRPSMKNERERCFRMVK